MIGISARLKTLGIDWQPRPDTQSDGPGPGDFEVQVTTDRARNSAAAGEAMTLIVAVTNRSAMPVYRLRAISTSANEDYHDKELLFGRIAPGKTVTRKVSLGQCETERRAALPQRRCRLSLTGPSREDTVRLTFAAERGEAPPRAELRLTVTSPPKVRTEPSTSSSAPSIEVTPLKLAYRDETVRIEGRGKSREGVLDLCVFANERKIFYQSASANSSSLPFAFDALLEPGINLIRVLVRDRNRVSSSRALVIRSDRPRAEPLLARSPSRPRVRP